MSFSTSLFQQCLGQLSKPLGVLSTQMVKKGVTLLGAIVVSVTVAQAESLQRGFSHPLDASNLDPHKNSSDTLFSLIAHYLQPLLLVGPDGALEPGLAESWRIKEDTVFQITLRDTAQWSDGVPITAVTVVKSLQRALSPYGVSDAKSLLSNIVGADQWIAGDTSHPLGVEAISDRQVDITLKSPDPMFGYILAHPYAAPLPVHTFDEDGQYPESNAQVSSAAYILSHHDEQTAIFKTNPKFHLNQPNADYTPPDFDEVIFRFGEFNEMIEAYLQMEIDILDYINQEQLTFFKQNPIGRIHTPTIGGKEFMALKPALPKAARKAIISVLDTEIINNILYGANQESTPYLTSWENENYPQKALPADYEYDSVMAAREAMLALGYTRDNPLEVCINLDEASNYEAFENYVTAILSLINVNISFEDRIHGNSPVYYNGFDQDYWTDDQTGETFRVCNITLLAFNSRLDSEEEMVDLFFNEGLFNLYREPSPELEDKYKRMKQEPNLIKRYELIADIEYDLITQYNVTAVANLERNSVVRDYIGGYENKKRNYLIPLSQHLTDNRQ